MKCCWDALSSKAVVCNKCQTGESEWPQVAFLGVLLKMHC